MDSVEYEQWFEEIWQGPALDKSLSVAAMAGDEMVAFTVIETAGDRAWSGMTGTIPAYRGRGLAKLVKSVALRRAAAAGITAAYTSNDDENGPMLAVNNWLGYQRVQTEIPRPAADAGRLGVMTTLRSSCNRFHIRYAPERGLCSGELRRMGVRKEFAWRSGRPNRGMSTERSRCTTPTRRTWWSRAKR